MAKISNSWKALERQIAEELRGVRVHRGSDFSVSDVDVKVPDFPGIKIDAKYRTSPWKHHGPLKECRRKYAKGPHDVPIVVTKTGREHGAVVCIDLKDFARLLDHIRVLENHGKAKPVGTTGCACRFITGDIVDDSGCLVHKGLVPVDVDIDPVTQQGLMLLSTPSESENTGAGPSVGTAGSAGAGGSEQPSFSPFSPTFSPSDGEKVSGAKTGS